MLIARRGPPRAYPAHPHPTHPTPPTPPRRQGCVFNQTGGNGLLLEGNATASSVRGNEFVHTGDSAIVSLGSTSGVDGTAATFPDRNQISANHIHEYGVYGKQTSCYFQALS